MLDTHTAFKRLKSAGMAEPKAEAIVDFLRTAIPDPRLDTFITTLYVGGAAVVVLLTALDFLIGP